MTRLPLPLFAVFWFVVIVTTTTTVHAGADCDGETAIGPCIIYNDLINNQGSGYNDHKTQDLEFVNMALQALTGMFVKAKWVGKMDGFEDGNITADSANLFNFSVEPNSESSDKEEGEWSVTDGGGLISYITVKAAGSVAFYDVRDTTTGNDVNNGYYSSKGMLGPGNSNSPPGISHISFWMEVPEPTSIAIFLTGFIILVLRYRKSFPNAGAYAA